MTVAMMNMYQVCVCVLIYFVEFVRLYAIVINMYVYIIVIIPYERRRASGGGLVNMVITPRQRVFHRTRSTRLVYT